MRGHQIVAELRSAGLDVAYAKEVCPGSPDPEVLKLAADDGRVVVTHDLGFGELAVRQGQPAAGVVILSLYALPAGARERYAAAQLRQLGDRALGHLAVIEPGRVRLRPLPTQQK
jgi:predicted nuclease of predicted toxin-antitoxin system